MAKRIIIDEFHLLVTAPKGLREPAYRAMKRTLDERRFQANLRQAVRQVFSACAPLRQAHVALSR